MPGTGTVYIDAKLSVIRRRAVGGGFHEELTILNHDDKPVDLTVRIDAGCDFADLFEVKDALKKKGKYSAEVDDGRLVLGYERETFRRETIISASTPAEFDKDGLTFRVQHRAARPGRPTWMSSPPCSARGYSGAERSCGSQAPTKPSMEQNLERWVDERAAARVRLGVAERRPTGAASSTSPRSASRRPSPEATACRPPACPGS